MYSTRGETPADPETRSAEERVWRQMTEGLSAGELAVIREVERSLREDPVLYRSLRLEDLRPGVWLPENELFNRALVVVLRIRDALRETNHDQPSHN
jgi:hypothetical protein